MTAPLPFDRIHLFELLKPKLGAEESKALVDAIDAISDGAKKEVDVALESRTNVLATKDDLQKEISQVKDEIRKLEIKMGDKFQSMLIWLVATIFGAAALIIAVMKFS